MKTANWTQNAPEKATFTLPQVKLCIFCISDGKLAPTACNRNNRNSPPLDSSKLRSCLCGSTGEGACHLR